ncbi:MAG: septum formation initiator family protein [Parvularculaceae bacterium]
MSLTKTLFTDVVAPAAAACWIGIEAYSAAFGAAGYRALQTLRAEAAHEAATLADLVARREALARHAAQLNRRSLDLDLLEERSRAVLGYVRDGDIVVPRAEFDAALDAVASR